MALFRFTGTTTRATGDVLSGMIRKGKRFLERENHWMAVSWEMCRHPAKRSEHGCREEIASEEIVFPQGVDPLVRHHPSPFWKRTEAGHGNRLRRKGIHRRMRQRLPRQIGNHLSDRSFLSTCQLPCRLQNIIVNIQCRSHGFDAIAYRIKNQFKNEKSAAFQRPSRLS